MSDPFERMNASIFARLGEDAFLRGVPCKIDIEFGVEVTIANEFSQMVSHKTVVDIHYRGMEKPCNRDDVIVNSIAYKLDTLLRDDNYSAKWTVV